jgi:hypothetical protein
MSIPIALKLLFSLQIPGFCEGEFQVKVADIKAGKDCDVLVGYKAVYRISFALAIFFFVFSLLMLKIKTSKDPRAAIHNGYVRLIINL